MPAAGWFSALASSFVVACSGQPAATAPAAPDPLPAPLPAPLHYATQPVGRSVVHTLRIPRSRLAQLTVAVSPTLQTVAEFAQQTQAVAVLNAGFFDPLNQQTTSFVTREGKQIADPQQNDRLMQNPTLAPDLAQILDRSEFRLYRCRDHVGDRAAITRHRAPLPAGCQLRAAVGAGPQLLPQSTARAERFVDDAGRDVLGSGQPNARAAIGLLPNGDVLWMMAAQSSEPAAGLTLAEMTAFLRSQGVEQALNLDGGSSASLFYAGTLQVGRWRDGQPVVRPVKSVLLLH